MSNDNENFDNKFFDEESIDFKKKIYSNYFQITSYNYKNPSDNKSVLVQKL